MIDSMARRFLNYKGIDGYGEDGSLKGKFSIVRSTKSVNNISIHEALWWGFAFGVCDELKVGDYVFIHDERYMIIRYIYETETREHSVWLVKCNINYDITRKEVVEVDENYSPILDDVVIGKGYGYEGVVTYRMRDIEQGRQDATKYSYILPICKVEKNDRLTIKDDDGYTEELTVSSVDRRALEGVVIIQCTRDVRQ